MADISLTYVTLESLPSEEILVKLANCATKVAAGSSQSQWKAKLSDRELVLVNYAEVDNEIIGFVAGYQLKPKLFYIWRGGVLEDYRSQGVATELLSQQAKKCKDMGFDIIKTKVDVKLKDMIICHLRTGFDICETNVDENNKVRLVMEKKL